MAQASTSQPSSAALNESTARLVAPTSFNDTVRKIASKATQCPCPPGRNLVVCIDGTSNQFSKENSNVVELYSRLVKDADQLTYYNSGIGTYVKHSEGWRSWLSLFSWWQAFVHAIDMATAWTLKSKVLSAYQWLSENYEDGDRIFLFGFSRGAYQVRVIAGMLELVGLLYKGNNEQIPFAYELYTNSISDDRRSDEKKQKPLCAHFKRTLSRPNVRAHFVGTWDTVSSVGIFRGRRLPETITGMKHVCYFRQALALDELRVKFLPEFANGGAAPSGENIKEVWFAGSHSDINLFGPSLRWMSYEAISSGLRMIPRQGEWSRIPLNDSMSWWWRILEYSLFPIPRLSYKGKDDIERW
ncbi:hypothetical protein GALMADRAFT_80066 [Galerina marginata CBS 339.88]|uniref:T6SS Phospholipase effector Tle1-like catalytic domain-containing protein n=1 Tax=Galerina marginata (strain CBS 339.88) TaxID=685588 RepID=A0A067S8A1_GALM3|nr:hypothetical protein GALMADRAFT_80066 [Galerina marginata CBS 339.88]